MNIKALLERWIQRQWSHNGLISILLSPLSFLTKCYLNHKSKKQPLHSDPLLPPLIVVGNIIVGGAGKTPVVLAVSLYLKERGWQPGIISRGYGAKQGSQARVGQGVDVSADHFGDEPALLAAQSGMPIAVHPKRRLAISALLAQFPETNIIIADDGLQHHAMPRDLEIIVQDERGIANGLLLPAGPLRETPDRLASADWLITQLSGESHAPKTPVPPDSSRHIIMRLAPIYFEQLSSGQKVLPKDWLNQYEQRRCSALAGIGQPQRFFTMLEQQGICLQSKQALADHQAIPASIFSRLNSEIILITAKDAVKCRQLTDKRIWVVHVQPHFSPSQWLVELEHELQRINQLRQPKLKR